MVEEGKKKDWARYFARCIGLMVFDLNVYPAAMSLLVDRPSVRRPLSRRVTDNRRHGSRPIMSMYTDMMMMMTGTDFNFATTTKKITRLD